MKYKIVLFLISGLLSSLFIAYKTDEKRNQIIENQQTVIQQQKREIEYIESELQQERELRHYTIEQCITK